MYAAARASSSLFVLLASVAAAGAVADALQSDGEDFRPGLQAVRMRPDNYLRCLLYFGRRLRRDLSAADQYDHRHWDAARRTVADSCREFLGRRDVLPAARRLVYDTANLYMQRVGRAAYEREMSAGTSASGSAAGSGRAVPRV